MARVVSFEMNSQNPETATKIYSTVFGWEISEPRWDYWPVETGSEPASGINGGIARGPSDYPHGTRITIEVDSIDAVMANAVANGAKVVRGKMEFDTFYLAYLVDPVGLGIGLIEPK